MILLIWNKYLLIVTHIQDCITYSNKHIIGRKIHKNDSKLTYQCHKTFESESELLQRMK